jgi:hypothetical protein
MNKLSSSISTLLKQIIQLVLELVNQSVGCEKAVDSVSRTAIAGLAGEATYSSQQQQFPRV